MSRLEVPLVKVTLEDIKKNGFMKFLSELRTSPIYFNIPVILVGFFEKNSWFIYSICIYFLVRIARRVCSVLWWKNGQILEWIEASKQTLLSSSAGKTTVFDGQQGYNFDKNEQMRGKENQCSFSKKSFESEWRKQQIIEYGCSIFFFNWLSCQK